jgi:Zn-dependent M28 family amino/carboxypeptidase
MFQGREAGSPDARLVAAYLEATLKSYGLVPAGDSSRVGRTYLESFTFFCNEKDTGLARFNDTLQYDGSQLFEAYNVLGMIPGRDSSRSIYIGAHYDHLGRHGDTIYYGADDNASGTAGLLALARNWAESGTVPAYNLIFAFWSAEEKGMLGSTYHVSANHLDTNAVVACLNLDMISRRYDTNSVMISIGLLEGADDFEQMAVEENSKLTSPFSLDIWFTDGDGGSDYVAFAKRGIPVMSFFSGYHADYHTPGDVYERTEPEKMELILQLVNQCLIRLALPGD